MTTSNQSEGEPGIQPIARDYLALDRTRMANERTLLAYIRTALGFAIGGGSLINFFPTNGLILALGWVLLALGAITLVVGILSFTRTARRTAQIFNPILPGPTRDPTPPPPAAVSRDDDPPRT